MSACIVSTRAVAAAVSPTAVPTSSMSVPIWSSVALETTRTGILSARSWAIDSADVNPAPPAMTRSGARLTIFSTSTVPKVTTSGSGLASAG